jgi:hypothetical protein
LVRSSMSYYRGGVSLELACCTTALKVNLTALS